MVPTDDHKTAARLSSESVRPTRKPRRSRRFFPHVSSGAPSAMIGATLTTRLAQDGIVKSSITAFRGLPRLQPEVALLSWVVDGFGCRSSPVGPTSVMAAVCRHAFDGVDRELGAGVPGGRRLAATAVAAISGRGGGATFDIVIDAYRRNRSSRAARRRVGMSQYGWRVGSVLPGRWRS